MYEATTFSFYFFLLMCLTLLLSTTAQAVDIPDANLRAAIEAALGKASGDTITVADMKTLTELRANNANITDLTGLEGATNLTTLSLGDNDISDISSVAGLTKLTFLALWYNSISDISPVAGLTNLQTLTLGNNSVSDISPVSGLTNLEVLILWGNNISDISPVVGLTQLIELNLKWNSISDISPLVANTGLGEGDRVNVQGNPLSDASIQTHIPALEGRGVTVEFDTSLEGFDDTLLEEPFNIPDPNLFTAIVDALGKTSGALITASDMANLTDLTARNAGISNLTGLEHATNLKSLWLDGEEVRPGVWENSNSVSDLSPLAGLTQLEALDFWQNSVSDISALAGLTNLTHLGLVGNNISDVSVLTGLTNLESLWLDGNPIADISPLAGLTQLTRLGLDNTSISDISALAGLTNLTWMRMERNNISDLSPLVANTGLGEGDEVHVRGNPLNRASIKTHVPALEGRGVMVEFDDVVAELVDIPDPNLRAAIERNLGKASGAIITTVDMATLLHLEARNANISDLTGLEAATNLTFLILDTNAITDISAVSGLTNLESLNLRNNSITDISAVSGLTNLESLNLRNNSISDLSAVSGLTNLESLNLRNNSISDLSAVSGLTNLTWLNLRNNSISDLSAVSGLTSLTFLILDNNNVSDLSPLVENTGLGSGGTVSLWENPLSEASINTHIPALQSRGVTVEFIQTPTLLLKISGTVTELDNLLIVEVRDNRNFPFEGVPVTFTVISGGGVLSVTNTTTDANGRAESRLTLGPDAGTNTVRASVEGISQTVTFSDVPEPPVDIPDPQPPRCN